MKHLSRTLVLALLFCASLRGESGAGDTGPAILIDMPAPHAYAYTDVLCLMRGNHIPYSVEGVREFPAGKALFTTQKVSVPSFCLQVERAFGLRCRWDNGWIRLCDRASGGRRGYCLLDKTIETPDFVNMAPREILEAVGKAAGVSFLAGESGGASGLPKISLSLGRTTIRNALDKMTSAAGLTGWTSPNPWHSPTTATKPTIAVYLEPLKSKDVARPPLETRSMRNADTEFAVPRRFSLQGY